MLNVCIERDERAIPVVAIFKGCPVLPGSIAFVVFPGKVFVVMQVVLLFKGFVVQRQVVILSFTVGVQPMDYGR